MSRRDAAPAGIQGTEGEALGSHADDRRRSSAAVGTGASPSPTSSAASERTPSATAGGPASPAPAAASTGASPSPTSSATGDEPATAAAQRHTLPTIVSEHNSAGVAEGRTPSAPAAGPVPPTPAPSTADASSAPEAASERTPSATAGGPASPAATASAEGRTPSAMVSGHDSRAADGGHTPSAAAGGPASPAPRPAGGPLGRSQRRRPRIGVVAVQGAFAEHVQRLRGLGCAVAELRQRGDLDQPLDALVLPGGESTTQSRLLRDAGMLGPLRERIIAGLPVLGTCAGLILLAERIEGTGDLRGLDAQAAAGRAAVEGLRTLPVTVSRNAYGRQLGSFHAEGAWEGRAADESRAIAPGQPPKPQEQPGKPDGARPAPTPVPLTFIRAPRIVQRGPGVRPLVTLGDQPVAVQYGSQIGAAFHPELDEDERIYRRLLDLAR